MSGLPSSYRLDKLKFHCVKSKTNSNTEHTVKYFTITNNNDVYKDEHIQIKIGNIVNENDFYAYFELKIINNSGIELIISVPTSNSSSIIEDASENIIKYSNLRYEQTLPFFIKKTSFSSNFDYYYVIDMDVFLYKAPDTTGSYSMPYYTVKEAIDNNVLQNVVGALIVKKYKVS